MPRPSLDFVADMTPETKRKLMSAVGVLNGMYEVKIHPKRDTRSLRQNAYFHTVIVKMFQEFLKDQDYEHNSFEAAKGFLKAKMLSETLVDPTTGEVIETRVRGTSELSVEEMTDFIDRCRFWLADFFGIIVPDPDPMHWIPLPEKQKQSA